MAYWDTCSTTESTGNVWTHWVTTSATNCTATTSAINNSPWLAWTCSTTPIYATGTSTQYIWNTWNHEGHDPVVEGMSEEEAKALVRRRNQQIAELREREAAERVKREAAERRAQELLEANLVLEERERLRKAGYFFVHGRSGCRYRVRKGRTGNVDAIGRDGRITHRLCAHPSEWVPDFDTMLAQKLMLEDNDDAFKRIANHTPMPGGELVMPALH